ncbi:MAG TPA: hypothetical protein VNP94_10710 [Actinomycetota bacterium]|nr:hypothetical protein [Actinomycetota bacterium]
MIFERELLECPVCNADHAEDDEPDLSTRAFVGGLRERLAGLLGPVRTFRVPSPRRPAPTAAPAWERLRDRW